MKFSQATLLLPATAVAAQGLSVAARATDLETITDEYLFDISLDQFITYRNAEDPDTLDWTSDGCTDSPDNPLGFDFVRTAPPSQMHAERGAGDAERS